ncbi:MAG: cytochrome c3 family protein [Pseudomonadota bacterium]
MKLLKIMKLPGMAIVAGMLFIAVIAVAGQNRGAQNISLDGGGRGNISFPHKIHQDTLTDCQACHDLFPQEPGAVLKAKQAGSLKNKQVMNEKCIACHKETKAAGKKTGPVKCSECHIKN